MLIKGIIVEDFVNYKLPSMTVEFPYCTFKCGKDFCQNSNLLNDNNLEISAERICEIYTENKITEAIVFQGLEPFDSFENMMELIEIFRKKTLDNIVIYSGYTEEELSANIEQLKKYKNIIIKFGRFIPDSEHIFDEVLGVILSSNNQYARKIS